MTRQINYYTAALFSSSLLVMQSLVAAPPQEALDACNGLNEANSCSIQTPSKLLSGTCLTVESVLACIPDNATADTNNNPDDINANPTDEAVDEPIDEPETSVVNTEATNINSTYDAVKNRLYIPIVAIDNSLLYEISLSLIGVDPVIMKLFDFKALNSTDQVSATYTSSTGILLVKSLAFDNQFFSLIFQLKGNQFELLSMTQSAYKLVDTGQSNCYNSSGSNVSCSNSGQDGAYNSNQPSYTNNGDGTITDNVSALVWQQTPDTNGDGSIDSTDKLSQSAAVSYCSNLDLANQSDWYLPDIKTMYSLINFSGEDVSNYTSSDTSGLTPFIDNNYFAFAYGDTDAGDRIIDVQYATSTLYVSTTMNGSETMFGVNMADGRIKGYGMSRGNSETKFMVQCVRGNESYATNSFSDNNDQTISDSATGLMWEKNDSQTPMDWDAAISQCENSTTANYSDWYLPNAKELQSMVDYTRSPDTTNSAAINSVFNATSFTNEAGSTDWGSYWSSTTHKNTGNSGDSAAYIAFGRALGYMNDQWLDVHGAGAQRSDPKSNSTSLDRSFETVTDANGNTAIYHGPQGDVVRINNFVRCVRSD
jgi:hypothetical protein